MRPAFTYPSIGSRTHCRWQLGPSAQDHWQTDTEQQQSKSIVAESTTPPTASRPVP